MIAQGELLIRTELTCVESYKQESFGSCCRGRWSKTLPVKTEWFDGSFRLAHADFEVVMEKEMVGRGVGISE